MINLYKIIIATSLLIVFMISMIPSISYFGSSTVANQLNLTFNNASAGLQTMVIGNITRVAFGGCNYPSSACNTTNRTIGFFANTNLFTGAAFVISGIGFIMQAVLNMPGIILIMLSTTLSVFDIPVYEFAADILLLVSVISGILVIIGISYFGKYNLREG